MEVVFAVLGLAALVYLVALVRIWYGLGRLAPGMVTRQPPATVLVAARNEEKHIAECLDALEVQDYGGSLEILVLNDSSTDSTAATVERYAARDPRIRLINVPPALDGTAPKKHALTTGLAASSGELVFVTDADCVVPTSWMSRLASHFTEDVGLVTGGVFLPEEPGLVAKMRNLDFAAYTFCSAGAMQTGWPLIATAMNLAYRREAFEEAGGFGRDAAVLSGDDDLLLHAIVRETSWRAAFAYGPSTVVDTQPVHSLGAFINQRMRWASKAFRYPPGMTAFLAAAFTLYAGLLVGIPLAVFGVVAPKPVLAAVAVKLFADALVVIRGCRLFARTSLLPAYVPAALLHLPYILTASIGGALGLFKWKGRGPGAA
ncbi:MAG: cellulose synthase/poly-beta-1,6-N-acetylglucosamine synthase-like glycosyltransferase [Rhodothermales bacterium]|jgi:cellulose synthase/poly-beta-1,6-N-acetylglucosamine synthase-like glycosyltransferase